MNRNNNKIIIIFITIIFAVIACVGLFQFVISNNEKQKELIEIEMQVLCSEQREITVNSLIYDPLQNAIENMQKEIQEINKINNKKEWYIEYKKIIKKYSDIIDPPETVYDYFTDEEVYLIQRVVETECYDQSFESKVNVASVILNRIQAGGVFGDSAENVITKPNQFAYDRTNISESTQLAVEYAFQISDTTNDCIAFRSDNNVENWYNWEYDFTDEAGHSFYREREDVKYEEHSY